MKRSATPEKPLAIPADAGSFTADQPYFLFNEPVDWMLGTVLHVVGARPSSQTPAAFLASVYQWAAGFPKDRADKIDAALVCCGNDFAVAWVHTTEAAEDFSKSLDAFAALLDVQLNIISRSASLKEGLWNKWNGIDYTDPQNISLNVQLMRPEKTDPVESGQSDGV